MSGAMLAWRAVPVVLVTAWLLALIGGFSLGGFVNLLIPAAIGAYLWDPTRGRSA